MSTKIAILLSAVAILASFAAGRFTAQGPEITTVQKVETKVDEKKDENKNIKTVEETVKKPDGTVVTTKTTEVDDSIHTDTKIAQASVTEQTIKPAGGKVALSALLGTRLVNPDGVPLYGAHLTKEFWGPATVGVWALSNGIVGVSVGLTF